MIKIFKKKKMFRLIALLILSFYLNSCSLNVPILVKVKRMSPWESRTKVNYYKTEKNYTKLKDLLNKEIDLINETQNEINSSYNYLTINNKDKKAIEKA